MPGQVGVATQLALPQHPAQLGFDGAPYAPSAREAAEGLTRSERYARARSVLRGAHPDGTSAHPHPEPRHVEELPTGVSRVARDQLCFGFDRAGVQMTFDEWQHQVADALRWFEGNTKRADRIEGCGRLWAVPVCRSCGHHNVAKKARSADCDSRVCPSCARKRAGKERALLKRALRKMPYKRRGKSWWVHTIPVPRPPGTSVAALRERIELVFDAERAVRAKLKEWGYTHGFVRVETAPGGLVHVHSFVRGRRVDKGELAELRAIAAAVHGGQQFNIRRARKGSIQEVAKYVTKGVALNTAGAMQTHPVLSAMVDVAMRNVRASRTWGDWDSFEDDADDRPDCPVCGSSDVGLVYVTGEQLAALANGPRGPPHRRTE